MSEAYKKYPIDMRTFYFFSLGEDSLCMMVCSLLCYSHLFSHPHLFLIKSVEIKSSIDCKWRTRYSRNLERSTISRWTNLINFSPSQFIIFDKLSIVTFIHFSYIMRVVHHMIMTFGIEKHWNSKNMPAKFH